MHPNPRRIAPIVLLIAIAGGAIWYFTQGRNSGSNGALAASGTIEGTQVVIAPELSGRLLGCWPKKVTQLQPGRYWCASMMP